MQNLLPWIDIDILAWSLVAGAFFRYNLLMIEACRVVGVRISSDDSYTGLQDAVTPPMSTNLSIAGVALIIIVVVAGFGTGGILAGVTVILSVILSSIISGLLLPKANSSHFRNRIHGSLVKRYASYKANKDTEREILMAEIIQRYESAFGSGD